MTTIPGLFNNCRQCQVLKVGGKFVLVMANGENMEEWVVFDQMRREERWRELLDKTRSVTTVAMAGLKSTFPSPSWMHFGTVNVNHGWMATVDEKTGYGNIRREDFVKLLESHGFRVDEAKTVTLEYKLHHDFVERFVQETDWSTLMSRIVPRSCFTSSLMP